MPDWDKRRVSGEAGGEAPRPVAPSPLGVVGAPGVVEQVEVYALSQGGLCVRKVDWGALAKRDDGGIEGEDFKRA